MEDAFGIQPGEARQPDDSDIRDFGYGLYILQGADICTAIEDWLKVVALNLVLTGYIAAIKIALSSDHPAVALACKKYSRQYLDYGEYTAWRHTIHLCTGCGHKWDIALQVPGNPLASLRGQLRDDGLWVHTVPVHRTKGGCQVASALVLKLGYFLHHCSNLALWAVLLLSPLILPVCLLLPLTAQTLGWPPLCLGYIVIILSSYGLTPQG